MRRQQMVMAVSGIEWAAEEVIGTPLPLSLEAAFGNTLSEGAWATLADGME